MSDDYLDASALAKRYLSEIGTPWLHALVESGAGNTLWLSEITEVEVAAALAARHRATGGITRTERDKAVQLLRQHCVQQYTLVATTRAITIEAVALTQRHRLRGYDAVQLATALAVAAASRAVALDAPIFVAADGDLVAAARAEGLTAEDPNHHS